MRQRQKIDPVDLMVGPVDDGDKEQGVDRVRRRDLEEKFEKWETVPDWRRIRAATSFKGWCYQCGRDTSIEHNVRDLGITVPQKVGVMWCSVCGRLLRNVKLDPVDLGKELSGTAIIFCGTPREPISLVYDEWLEDEARCRKHVRKNDKDHPDLDGEPIGPAQEIQHSTSVRNPHGKWCHQCGRDTSSELNIRNKQVEAGDMWCPECGRIIQGVKVELEIRGDRIEGAVMVWVNGAERVFSPSPEDRKISAELNVQEIWATQEQYDPVIGESVSGIQKEPVFYGSAAEVVRDFGEAREAIREKWTKERRIGDPRCFSPACQGDKEPVYLLGDAPVDLPKRRACPACHNTRRIMEFGYTDYLPCPVCRLEEYKEAKGLDDGSDGAD